MRSAGEAQGNQVGWGGRVFHWMMLGSPVWFPLPMVGLRRHLTCRCGVRGNGRPVKRWDPVAMMSAGLHSKLGLASSSRPSLTERSPPDR